VSLGGRVLVPPRMDRHGGMIAIVADPVGAAIGLFDWPESETEVTP
jgi:predicted enzyme related to lactoylglutathione lyase